jgi:hypothetical protein
VFVYNAKTFERIIPNSIDFEKGEIFIEQVFCDIEVNFDYIYNNTSTSYVLGSKMI